MDGIHLCIKCGTEELNDREDEVNKVEKKEQR